MSQAVESIIEQIKGLDLEDRRELVRQLDDLEEAHWQDEAAKARLVAKERGIDQKTIDDAIDRLRYGS